LICAAKPIVPIDIFKYQLFKGKGMTYRRQKKGQGLSINTIIIAALGLAVLVILFAVMTGRLGIFGKGVDTTQQQLTECNQQCKVGGFASGSPVTDTSCRAANTEQIYGSFKDVGAGQVCCCSRT
jgi:hypothetical protein